MRGTVSSHRGTTRHMAVYRRILLATDLGTESLQLAIRARNLARALDAELELLHVIELAPPVAPIPPDAIGPTLVTEQAELLEVAREQIGSLARELGVPEASTDIRFGFIRSELIEAAARRKADLIVIGNHERHGLAVLIKPPTEDALVHHAPCDVLAVRLRQG
jgi:universal stress protein A